MAINIPLPDNAGIDQDDRFLIADEILEFIRERTDTGRDKDGRKFTSYSKSYRESLDFEIAGKSAGQVNLKQTGDMMIALQLLQDKRDNLKIGYQNELEENDRAEGHITGAGRLPKRNFLGISRRRLAEIIAAHSELTQYGALKWLRDTGYDNTESDKFK